MTVALRAPLSHEPPGENTYVVAIPSALPDPGIEPGVSCNTGDSYHLSHQAHIFRKVTVIGMGSFQLCFAGDLCVLSSKQPLI